MMTFLKTVRFVGLVMLLFFAWPMLHDRTVRFDKLLHGWCEEDDVYLSDREIEDAIISMYLKRIGPEGFAVDRYGELRRFQPFDSVAAYRAAVPECCYFSRDTNIKWHFEEGRAHPSRSSMAYRFSWRMAFEAPLVTEPGSDQSEPLLLGKSISPCGANTTDRISVRGLDNGSEAFDRAQQATDQVRRSKPSEDSASEP